MDHAGTIAGTQRGSVRLALLCALAGAAAVFSWNAWQPVVTEAPTAPPQVGTAQPSAGAGPATPVTREPTGPAAATAPHRDAGIAQVDSTDTVITGDDVAPQTDADGFSPDYGALVDDFQRQRALDPLIDD
ncbi:MAG: hypothetical protein R3E65_03170 [Steroidobacteraceae bacterium]